MLMDLSTSTVRCALPRADELKHLYATAFEWTAVAGRSRGAAPEWIDQGVVNIDRQARGQDSTRPTTAWLRPEDDVLLAHMVASLREAPGSA